MIAAAHASAKEGRSEDQELEELQGMMGGVPRGMYIKLEQAQKNRDLADKVRKEREELDALREQRAQELKERMDKLRLRREHKHTAAREAHASKVREQGRMVRQEVRDLEQARDEHNQEHWRRARERVEVANNLDAKLDTAEAAQDQRERDEAAEARAVLAKRAAAAKEKADAKRNFLNEKVRQAHAQAAARKQSNLATKRMRAGQTQDAKRQWNEAEQSNKQAHLTEARRKAQKRAKEKAEAKERMNEAAAKRRAAAREEKRNNEDATAALEAEVKKNQLARARSYARRYVPTEAVEHLEASDTFRRLYGLTDANGQIKTVKRPTSST